LWLPTCRSSIYRSKTKPVIGRSWASESLNFRFLAFYLISIFELVKERNPSTRRRRPAVAQPTKTTLFGGVRGPGLRAASAAPIKLDEPDFHAATLHGVHGV